MLSNQNAQILADKQAAMDTTAPVVDSYRPEATADSLSSTPNPKQLAGNTIYHLLFVGIFLFGGIIALGSLTGELEIVKDSK